MIVSVCVPACMPSCLCVVVFNYVYVDMSLHVLVYILTTCTCVHTHYMYVSTGGRSEVISTDPKIAPVNYQPSVYGELTDSGQMVQNYNCYSYYCKTSTVSYVHYTY